MLQPTGLAVRDAAALATALDAADSVPDALAHYARLQRWHVRLYRFLSVPWLLAGIVSGQLLSPLNRLQLETERSREVVA